MLIKLSICDLHLTHFPKMMRILRVIEGFGARKREDEETAFSGILYSRNPRDGPKYWMRNGFQSPKPGSKSWLTTYKLCDFVI